MKQTMWKLKTKSVSVAILTVVLTTTTVFAQTTENRSRSTDLEAERIAVFPFVNTTDVEQWDTLGEATAQTIELTLRLSGQYDVAAVDDLERFNPYSPEGALVLSRIVAERRLDAAIIGRISALENGRVELQAAVYRSETGEIIGAETREAFGSFDILDAADELVVIASSAFLGYQINFGGVILKPSRPDVEYRVVLDGIEIGTNISSIPQVLTGTRTIEIVAVTAMGEKYVYTNDHSIRSGEAIVIDFNLPAVTSREQREIRASHDVATDLLGRPGEYIVAFDALRESRRLLMASSSPALDPYRQRQDALESIWRLEEEMYRLSPTDYMEEGRYELGGPEEMLPGTTAVTADYNRRTDELRVLEEKLLTERIERNGTSQVYLLHLLWTQALNEGDVERAEALLRDMVTTAESYELEATTFVEDEAAAWKAVSEDASVYGRRSRRPWPYLGLAVGLGGLGFGGYYIATDQVGTLLEKGDEYHDEYELSQSASQADHYREKAEETYDDAEFAEFVQWSSIAAGGLVTLISTWRIIHNRQAERSFLHDWVRERYGREIALADRLSSRGFLQEIGEREEAGSGDSVQILVLGPPGDVVHIEGRPRILPVLIEQPYGELFEIDRAPIAETDRQRIYTEPFSMVVVE